MSRNLILKLTMLTSLAFGALTISACGFLSMPDKMDQTNGAMASMQQKMDTTNTTTAAMGSKMDQTNESIRKQTLEVALDHLLAKENTTYLSPAPTGMMPWAQAFADNMHEDEFVQLVYLYMQEINEVKPPDSMKYTCTLADLADPNPNPTDLTDACLKASQQAKKIDPTTKTIKIFTPDFIASVDHDKTVKYYAVMAISGFASQKMIAETVKTEVSNGGQYNDTVLTILDARAMFLHDILLENTLLNHPLDDPGKLAKAVEYDQDLDYIATLPFASDIAVNTHGMMDPNDDIHDQLDLRVSVPQWVRIDQAFSSGLQQKYKDAMKSPADPTGANLLQLKATTEKACQALNAWDGTQCVQK